MFVLLLTLLGIALTFILAGLLLSIPKAQASQQRAISYAARGSDTRRTGESDVGVSRTSSSVGVARASGGGVLRTSGNVGSSGVRRASISGSTGMRRYPAEVERRSGSRMLVSAQVDGSSISGLQVSKPTPWLGVTLILLALFGFCLFSMRLLFSNPGFLVNPFIVDNTVATTGTTAKNANTQSTAVLSGASKALVRLNQLDPAQYASAQDADKWAYSACSAAAMTEVINAYGHQYQIKDILSVEAKLGEITPEQGLLESVGIERTVARFGFKGTILSKPSLDNIINLARQGTPIIVSFPPDHWPGGHILVVTGGTSSAVYLADSSKLNMPGMSRERFLSLWEGLAISVVPS